MEWILNELSLERRFTSVDELVSQIVALFKVRNSHPNLVERFLCHRNIGNVEVLEGMSFAQFVMRHVPKDLKTGLLSWVSKKGPFWCDDRTENEDDYFEHQGRDVTDKGLGECARRVINKSSVTAFSLSDGGFDCSPLTIEHGLEEERLGKYDVANIFDTLELTHSAQSVVTLPRNWSQALDQLKQKYARELVFSDAVFEQISPVPFSLADFRSLDERFAVLKRYLNSRENGEHTEESDSILREFFAGTIEWFSPESSTNERRFREQLKFIQPLSGKKESFSWHGKVKSQANIRFYFDWPVSAEQNVIHIVYLGQKITKH